MTYREVEWLDISRIKAGKTIKKLDIRRRFLERDGEVTPEIANQQLLPTARQALMELNRNKEWETVDAIIWGRWLYRNTGITIYDNPLDANAEGEKLDVLRIIRF